MLRFPVLIRRHGRYLTDMENTQVARRPSIESIPQPQPTSAAGLSASTSQAKSVDSPRRHVPRVRKPKHDAADPNTSTSPSKASMPARAGSGPRPQPSFAQQQRPRVEAAGHQSGSAIHLHTLPGGLPARARETQRSSPNWRSNASPFADKGKGRAVGTPAEEPEVSSDDNLSVLQVVSSLDRPLEAQLKALADVCIELQLHLCGLKLPVVDQAIIIRSQGATRTRQADTAHSRLALWSEEIRTLRSGAFWIFCSRHCFIYL